MLIKLRHFVVNERRKMAFEKIYKTDFKIIVAYFNGKE